MSKYEVVGPVSGEEVFREIQTQSNPLDPKRGELLRKICLGKDIRLGRLKLYSLFETVYSVWNSLVEEYSSRLNQKPSETGALIRLVTSKGTHEIGPGLAECILDKEQTRRESVYRTVGMFPHELAAVK